MDEPKKYFPSEEDNPNITVLKEKPKGKKKNKRTLIIVIAIVVVIAGAIGALVILASNVENTNAGQENQIIPPANSNVNGNTNEETENLNTLSPLSTNTEMTVEGMVFIKGYKTPSESYGISSTEGYEIGFGSYDSMKEQFRPYVGERITITFTGVCRSAVSGCCRSLFNYCGTVKSWEPLEE